MAHDVLPMTDAEIQRQLELRTIRPCLRHPAVMAPAIVLSVLGGAIAGAWRGGCESFREGMRLWAVVVGGKR